MLVLSCSAIFRDCDWKSVEKTRRTSVIDSDLSHCGLPLLQGEEGARNKRTNKPTNKQQTNKPTNKQTNKQTNQQTNKPTIKQTNKQTNGPVQKSLLKRCDSPCFPGRPGAEDTTPAGTSVAQSDRRIGRD